MKETQIKSTEPMSQSITFDPINFIKAYREINSKEKPQFKERKQKEAEAIVELVRDYHQSSIANLATKDDVARSEQATKSDILSLRQATKDDISKLEQSTKTEIARLDSKFDVFEQKILTSQYDMLNKILISIAGMFVAFGLVEKLFF